METILKLTNIGKTFGGVHALKGVDFDLHQGEVHGLVGENGAGKSTLMRILAGVYSPQEGEVLLRGNPVRFSSAKAAKRHGIGMVHQELSCVPALSVAENMCLGDQPRNALGFIQWGLMRQRASRLLGELGIEVNVRTPLEQLDLGVQQLIEIARVTHSGADILILDEPTSALSPPEVARLFELINRLKEQGKSIVFISHFLDDVLAICDRVTVLRNGEKVDTFQSGDLSKGDIIHHMLGKEARTIEQSYEREYHLFTDDLAETALTVENMSAGHRVQNVSFHVKRGEILGLYGGMGAGHAELGECLYGLRPYDTGQVLLDDKPLRRAKPHKRKRAGFAYVSSDRKASLFLDCEIFKNVTIAFLKQLIKMPIRKRHEINAADHMVGRLHVKTPSSLELLGNLSGGNQQKVALARWLVWPIRVLILNEPTRGMDVGAKEDVMRIVKTLKSQGVAVILISSEPETIIANSDRIMVFSKGEITHEFVNEYVSKDKIMRCA